MKKSNRNHWLSFQSNKCTYFSILDSIWTNHCRQKYAETMTIYDYSILRFFEMILLLHKSPRKRWPHNEVTRIRPRIRPKKPCVQVPINKVINTELGHCEDVDRSISNQQVHAVPMAQSWGLPMGMPPWKRGKWWSNRRNWHGPTKNATDMSSERPWLFGRSIPNVNPGFTWG